MRVEGEDKKKRQSNTKKRTTHKQQNGGKRQSAVRSLVQKKEHQLRGKKTGKESVSLLADVQVHDAVGEAALKGQRDVIVVLHDDVVVVFVLVAQAQGLSIGATATTKTDLFLDTLNQLGIAALDWNDDQVRILLVVDLDLELCGRVPTQSAVGGLLTKRATRLCRGRVGRGTGLVGGARISRRRRDPSARVGRSTVVRW